MSPNNLPSFKGSSTISTMFPRKPSSAIVLQIHTLFQKPYRTDLFPCPDWFFVFNKDFLSIEEQTPSLNLPGQRFIDRITPRERYLEEAF